MKSSIALLVALTTSLCTAMSVTGCATTVPEGHLGLFVYASSGVDKSLLKEGIYWHMPWTNVLLFPSQWDEKEEKIDVLTKDYVHLTVQAGIATRPNPNELYQLQQEYGTQYYDTIVQSAFFTATRTVLAQYPMTELPENSEKIEAQIREHVAKRLSGKHLELGHIALQHIDFPATVQNAIEHRLVIQEELTQKQAETKVAQQDAAIARIRAESASATAKIAATSDAEDATIRADGEAKAQAMLAKTLTPLLVQLRALTSPTSKLVVVPEGKNLSVVLGTGNGNGADAKP